MKNESWLAYQIKLGEKIMNNKKLNFYKVLDESFKNTSKEFGGSID